MMAWNTSVKHTVHGADVNNKQRVKRKLRFIPRLLNEVQYLDARPRKNAVYFRDFCCDMCYFDWGRWFAKQHMYKHDSAFHNYHGILKKYWVSVSDQRYGDGDE
jgi:hypothetical protein